MSKVGIKDIAARTGVSIATVSNALRNPGRVSEETRKKVLSAARKAGYTPNRLAANLRTDLPQVFVDIDRTKAQKQGNPIEIINQTMQANLGSLYVNDFNIFGRAYRVILQAEKQYRNDVEDIGSLKVRNKQGDMIAIETLINISDTAGPGTIFRYNLYPTAKISGQAAPGYSSGDAIAEMDENFAQCEEHLAGVALGASDPGSAVAFEDAFLEYAGCMREQGIDMPDPDFSGEGGALLQMGPQTPGEQTEFDAAHQACKEILADIGMDL